MANTKKVAANAAEKKVANANEVSKSVTATTPKSGKSTTDKAQPKAEKTAATRRSSSKATTPKSGKAQQSSTSKEVDAVANEILLNAKHSVLSLDQWLTAAYKAAKGLKDKTIAKAIESHWATLKTLLRKADSYYAESVVVTDEKTGTKRTLVRFYPVEWRDATKVAEIGRAIEVTELLFKFGKVQDDAPTKCKSVKDLTVERTVTVNKTVTMTDSKGVKWQRTVGHKVTKKFRPVEIVDFSYAEFSKRFRFAMQNAFGENGFKTTK